MKLALCQLKICFEDKQATFAKTEVFLKQAAAVGADMIAFPEMTLSGFSMDTKKTKENGETKDRFALLSKKYNIAVGFGWVCDCGERCRNMYTVLDKNGLEIAEYAKIHPFSYAGENKYFEGGSKQSFFELCGMKIGLAVCYDLRFPPLFGVDCDLFLIPANWPEARAEHWRTLLKARAIENRTYFAGINCVGDMNGQRYAGDTSVYDPDGRLIGELHDTEGLLTAVLSREETTKAREEFPVRDDRRYDIYREIYTERDP